MRNHERLDSRLRGNDGGGNDGGRNEGGSVGLIVVIIVLGFMMSIATSYSLLIQTETIGSDVSVKYLRARAAALAGVGYVVAQLAATDTTFVGPGGWRDRIYFLYASTSASLINRMTGTGPPLPYTDLTAPVATQWFYGTPLTSPLPDEVPEAMQFKVTNYPNGVNFATSAYIKSIGKYLEIEPNQPTVILATWTAEVIARISIDLTSKMVSVDYWRPRPVETCALAGDPFFTTAQKP